ncbi:MAG: thiamine pyrophosphate-binding protein [Nocardioides sp.]
MDSGTAIARILAAGGVRRFYTVPGESFLEIIDGVEASPEISLISTRHEGGASFMAEADAKMTGRPAVVAGTRGVGAANLSIGVHTAFHDSTPMVVMLGQVETRSLGREGFQEVDLPAFFGPISKHAVTVMSTDRIAEHVSEALRIAVSGRPGPVVLAFPADVLAGDIAEPDLQGGIRRATSAPVLGPPRDDAVTEIVRRIDAAQRPVVIAGERARAHWDRLAALSERLDLGVYSAFRRSDVFDNDDPRYLGHLTLGAPPVSLLALAEADLVLVLGSRLDEITAGGYDLPARSSYVVHVDTDPVVAGAVVPTDLSVVADVGLAIDAMLAVDRDERPPRDWSRQRSVFEELSTVGPSRASTGCDPARVIKTMATTLSDDTIVATDAGNFSAFFHRYWRFRRPFTCVGSTNGAMGYGIPAAIGSRLAAPDRPVVAVVGDGGFLMTGNEIETAARYGCDLTAVVFRNGLHGTIAMHQAREVGRLSGVSISPVDISALTRSLGGVASLVTAEDDLADALTEAVNTPGPSVVEVVTDSDLINPTQRLSELLPD